MHTPPLSPGSEGRGSGGGTTASGGFGSPTSGAAVRQAIELAASGGNARDGWLNRQQQLQRKQLQMQQRPSLPRFFTPGEGGRGRGRRAVEDHLELKRAEIESLWRGDGESIQDSRNFLEEGLPPTEFVRVTRDLCGFPAFFNRPLMARIQRCYDPSFTYDPLEPLGPNRGEGLRVQLRHFLEFWRDEIEPYDHVARFFRLVKQPSNQQIQRSRRQQSEGANNTSTTRENNDYSNWCITRDDFMIFLEELLFFHPGLQFLVNHEEFQEK